jgi:hypothetical protein
MPIVGRSDARTTRTAATTRQGRSAAPFFRADERARGARCRPSSQRQRQCSSEDQLPGTRSGGARARPRSRHAALGPFDVSAARLKPSRSMFDAPFSCSVSLLRASSCPSWLRGYGSEVSVRRPGSRAHFPAREAEAPERGRDRGSHGRPEGLHYFIRPRAAGTIKRLSALAAVVSRSARTIWCQCRSAEAFALHAR